MDYVFLLTKDFLSLLLPNCNYRLLGKLLSLNKQYNRDVKTWLNQYRKWERKSHDSTSTLLGYRIKSTILLDGPITLLDFHFIWNKGSMMNVSSLSHNKLTHVRYFYNRSYRSITLGYGIQNYSSCYYTIKLKYNNIMEIYIFDRCERSCYRFMSRNFHPNGNRSRLLEYRGNNKHTNIETDFYNSLYKDSVLIRSNSLRPSILFLSKDDKKFYNAIRSYLPDMGQI